LAWLRYFVAKEYPVLPERETSNGTVGFA